VEGLNIGLDLIIVLTVAIAGGMLARLLRLPIILGYLAGGIIIGPFGLGLVNDTGTIDLLAQIGVILLLFAIGLEFSLKELLKLGKISIIGGLAQIALTAAAGFGMGWFLNNLGIEISVTGSIFFGFMIALSSTMVVLKLLMDRGEIDTTHGRILLGILLVQDISVVPMIIAIQAVGGDSVSLLSAIGIAMAKAIGFITAMLTLGYWGMPWLLKKVAAIRSRELFLLTVIVICLAAAFGTYAVGLSAAFGAFAAGLLISQSSFSRQAFADILPLRDTFAALFFVSLGLLADRDFVFRNIVLLASIVVIIILFKFLIGSAVPRIFGYGHKTALMVGTGLINIGEFAFILALMGVENNIFSREFYNLIIASAILTMLITPFAMSLNSFLYRKLSQTKMFARQLTGRIDPGGHVQDMALSRHAVICGYGTVGRRVAEVMEKQKFTYLVIELDPTIISELNARGIPCIYGDASNPEILAHADLDKARVLVCTVPDYMATKLTTSNARKINPKLDIVARVHRDGDVELLKDVGVTEFVLPFFEGSLEMIRHTLHRFGMTNTEIQYILNTLRAGQMEKQEKK
jgi:monovalent cation:H+ antiporter-2, CPA2 family